MALKMTDRSALKTTDSYGYPVDPAQKRHKDCRCPVPCQMRFPCRSKLHKGSRGTPWCNGMGESEECDTCWWRKEKRRSKKKKAKKQKTKKKVNNKKKPRTKARSRGARA